MASTGRSDASTAPTKFANLETPASEYPTILVRSCDLVFLFYLVRQRQSARTFIARQRCLPITYKAAFHEYASAMIFRSQGISYPARGLVRRQSRREGHKIRTLLPDIPITAREIDTSKSRTPEPVLQCLYITAARRPHLRHLVELQHSIVYMLDQH